MEIELVVCQSCEAAMTNSLSVSGLFDQTESIKIEPAELPLNSAFK